MPYITVSREVCILSLAAHRALTKRPRCLELGLGWGDAILLPDDEVTAITIDRWVHLHEVGSVDVCSVRNSAAGVAIFHRVLWMAVGFRASGEGWWRHACTCAGGSVLGWTNRRTEWGTLWCGEADIVTRDEVRAVAVEGRVERVEIR